jgi:transposase
MKRKVWKEIHEFHEEGWSKRQIARKTGLSRKSVHRALNSQQPPAHVGRKRGSVLDGHQAWLLAHMERTPTITAARLHAMLIDDGVKVGASIVREHVARLRPRARKAYLTLHFQPGECAQVDWGTVGSVEIENCRRRLSVFVMVLAHSRMLYAEFTLMERMEHWLAAHARAFEFFGGVPQRVMIDNLKTGVKNNHPGEETVFNSTYLDFAGHYGFKPVACTPYKPNQKGRVENAVGYIKKAFVAGRELKHVPALAEALKNWLANGANIRVHGTTGKIPADVFAEEERPVLQPLPAYPYDCCVLRTCQSDSQFRVTIDTNRYSVPASYASRRLQLHLYDNRVKIYDGETQLAEHLRSYARKKDILFPAHQNALLEKQSGAAKQRQVAQFYSLCGEAEHYFSELKERRVDYWRHIREILALAQTCGKQVVARALRDTAEHGSYSSEYVAHLIKMRSQNKTYQSPLHVPRNADLLEIKTPEADLSIYGAK